MNDTLGPEGIVPSALVSGEYPSVTTRSDIPSKKATLSQRANMLDCARAQMEKAMAESKIKRSLKHAIPPGADRSTNLGTKLWFGEKIVNNRIGEWLGPYIVTGVADEKKLVCIRDAKIGPSRPFNIVQVKHYVPPESYPLNVTPEENEKNAAYFVHEIRDALRHYGHPTELDVQLTEVLSTKDSRAKSQQMAEAKRTEIRNIINRGTFKVILKEDIPKDANVLPGRFVLSLKSTEDGEVKYKARYVIGGHRDKLKHMMVHSSTTLQPNSVWLLLALAAIYSFDVWTSYITQAYLQSAEPIARDIFIKNPTEEFELHPSQCLQFLKPLYGLCESGDLWDQPFDSHHRCDLGMEPMRSDPALYILMSNGLLKGLSGGCLDDIIRTGDKDFRRLSQKTHERFDMGEDSHLPCQYTGFSLSRDNNGDLFMDQNHYLNKLEQLTYDASFSNFRSARMKLAWLSNTRPDCLFHISQHAQVTEDKFDKNKREVVKKLNRGIKLSIDNRYSLRVTKIDKDSLRVIGFSDASFANNENFYSQLGYICMLGDKHNNAILIHFKFYKARRVARSAMAPEVIAFSDMSGVAITLSQEIAVIMKKKIPVQLLSDNKSLFDVISKGSRTSEKRIMLNIASPREAFRAHVVSDIGFVRSSNNIADGLTKDMSLAQLISLMKTALVKLHPEQWIIRK